MGVRGGEGMRRVRDSNLGFMMSRQGGDNQIIIKEVVVMMMMMIYNN